MLLDHVFVFVENGEAAERAAVAAGLVPTHRRRHLRQGTQNVCFRFGAVFIELLWVVDRAEITSTEVERTGLWERSQAALGTCPFGVCLRGEPDFDSWAYDVPFPPGISVQMCTDSHLGDRPLLFAFAVGKPAEPFDQPLGKRITGIELAYPGAVPDRYSVLTEVGVREEHRDEPRLVVTIDEASTGRTLDVPAARLTLRL